MIATSARRALPRPLHRERRVELCPVVALTRPSNRFDRGPWRSKTCRRSVDSARSRLSTSQCADDPRRQVKRILSRNHAESQRLALATRAGVRVQPPCNQRTAAGARSCECGGADSRRSPCERAIDEARASCSERRTGDRDRSESGSETWSTPTRLATTPGARASTHTPHCREELGCARSVPACALSSITRRDGSAPAGRTAPICRAGSDRPTLYQGGRGGRGRTLALELDDEACRRREERNPRLVRPCVTGARQSRLTRAARSERRLLHPQDRGERRGVCERFPAPSDNRSPSKPGS